MATKTIITRIKNKVDELAKWQAYTGTLLDGEIVVVRVPTGSTYTNPVTGAKEPVIELLMKVGDGTTTFANLPWMSAKASDVYDWAKAAKVEFNSTDNKIYFKKADNTVITSIDLSAINAKITALENSKLSDITVTPDGNTGVVKNVTKDGTGKIKVSRSTVATADIADSAVTTAKIADSNVTTAKIADGAITNAKLGTDISSDKINVGSGTAAGTLSKKLSDLDAAVTGFKGSLSVSPASATTNGVVQGVTYDNSTGVFTVSYTTVAAGDIASNAVTTAKIKDANVTAAKLATDSVTTVKIADGNVTNDKIASVSSDKISVDSGTTDGTLSKKLSEMDAAIIAADNKAGHSHPYLPEDTLYAAGATKGGAAVSANKVNKSITVQLNSGTTEGTNKFTFDGSAAKSINITPSAIGAATADSVSGLTTRVETAEGEITSLKNSISGGVHFIGTTTTALSDGATTSTVTVNSKSHTPSAGDVVLYGEKEFIWSGSAWKELGDLSRVGAIETAIAAMDVTATNVVATTHKFVSQVTQTDGKVAVTYTQPSASDISYSGSDVGTKLAAIDAEIAKKMDTHDHPYAASSHAHGNITNSGTITSTAVTSATGVLVYDSNNKIQRATAANARAIIGAGTSNLTIGTTSTTAAAGNHIHSGYESRITAVEEKLDGVASTVGDSISSAINDLDFDEPTASTSTSTTFIDTISQTNGKIAATKKTLPSASTSNSGIVQLDDTVTSTSTTLAATANAVKTAYDAAYAADTKVTSVQANYVRFDSTDSKLYVGSAGVDEIIFDCGGAFSPLYTVKSYTELSSTENPTFGTASKYRITINETLKGTDFPKLNGVELTIGSANGYYSVTVAGITPAGRYIYLVNKPSFTPTSGDVIYTY